MIKIHGSPCPVFAGGSCPVEHSCGGGRISHCRPGIRIRGSFRKHKGLPLGIQIVRSEKKCYVDGIGSYPTNGVAINWNALMAWPAALLDELR